MNLGFVGLGRMGANMVKRLLGDGHKITAFDINPEARAAVKAEGAATVGSLSEVPASLETPRVIWLMLPAGKITEDSIKALLPSLDSGDILIEGGNSFYKDSMRRAEELKHDGILYLDAGTSGGIWGLTEGYCLMVGGKPEAFKAAQSIFKSLAPKEGYLHAGPSGAGHYVKMVHNAIEYAMLQSYAEGFEMMEAKKEFDLDLGAVSALWNRGSVVRSWLLELLESAFDKSPDLRDIRGYVDDSGEGRWSVIEAVEEAIPAPTIAMSLFARFRSRQDESFGAKVIAALRNEFGGHAVKKSD